MDLKIEIVFAGLSAVSAFELLPPELLHGREVRLYGEPVKHNALREEIARRRHFDIIADGQIVTFGVVAAQQLQYLGINLTPTDSDAFHLVSGYSRQHSFVQARLFDQEFERWQNAFNPLSYSLAGRPPPDLPLISNGLPPPLTADVYDISQNVGRRVLRHGYIEAIGHRMWFSNLFWKAVGQKGLPEKLESVVNHISTENGVYYVHVRDNPFCNDDVAGAEELREALFGVDS